MGFQVSPGVDVREIDLTNVIPAVSTTVGGIAMRTAWGPVDELTLVDSENMLVDVFGKPNNDNFRGWFTAANFLSYGNALRVVRVVDSATAKNAYYGGSATGGGSSSDGTHSDYDGDDTTDDFEITGSNPPYISNETDLEEKRSSTLASIDVIARYPGALGNSLRVAMYNDPEDHSTGNFIDSDGSSAGTTFNTLDSIFDSKPNSTVGGGAAGSKYVTDRGGSKDELNLVVIDYKGEFTGIPGTILEKYELLSLAHDAKSDDGSSNYFIDVINGSSEYIAFGKGLTWGTTAINDSANDSTVTYTYGSYLVGLTGGSDGDAPQAGDFYAAGEDARGYRLLEDAETVDVSLLLMGGGDDDTDSVPDASGSNNVISKQLVEICEARKDCVAFVSPAFWTCDNSATTNESDRAANMVKWRNEHFNKSSSYAVIDSGWKYQYDAYNDVFRWVPLNGDVAGLCVRTDQQADPWFSPAGFNRGQINRVTKLAHNPRQAHRDDLYQAGINPVVAFPGQGTILFGDKTALAKPSAFDRINVRRLFIVLEKAIATASKFQLFELNDQFTRAQFVAMVQPFLRDVKGRRGIFDFKVVCDSSNNTPAVIDGNRFVADIFIKPARSINFMQLNFIATRTGASFSEVAGAV
tara:strand:+ start:3592 stop:5502 length:1911 start_codon:yes stop_codon:yes gene_type:complete